MELEGCVWPVRQAVLYEVFRLEDPWDIVAVPVSTSQSVSTYQGAVKPVHCTAVYTPTAIPTLLPRDTVLTCESETN